MTADQLIALLAHIADLAAENTRLRTELAEAQKAVQAALEQK